MAPRCELGFEAGDGAQLRSADRREVLGVREENRPVVSDPLMKVDGSLRGLCGKVGSYVIDAE